MFVLTVQAHNKGCVCSERLECLPCLERTAAHTLLSFSNTNNVQPAGFVVSSRVQLKPNAVSSFELEAAGFQRPTAVLVTEPPMDTEVDTSCQSSCDDTTAADDNGLTPQMKRSRLAQVGGCRSQVVSLE